MNRSVLVRTAVAGVAVAALALTGCSSGEPTPGPTESTNPYAELTGTLDASGASFPNAYYQAALDAFAEVAPDLEIQYRSTGSGTGKKEFGEGSAKKFDPIMVQMGHPQATIALLDPTNHIDSHFSGPPFMQTALKNPAVHPVLRSFDLVGASTSLLAYTSNKFYDANLKLVEIFIAALNEANALTTSDPKKAAELYLQESKEKYTVDEIAAIIKEPGTIFTTVPKGTEKFATFMHKVGLLDQKAGSWKDFFFPVMHGAAGD